jgi:hypothetical protein
VRLPLDCEHARPAKKVSLRGATEDLPEVTAIAVRAEVGSLSDIRVKKSA